LQLAEMVSHVIGVDTHKHSHTAAVVDAQTGRAQPAEEAPATRDGYDALLDYADTYSTAADRAWAIEGTGSYGAGLAEHLAARGEWVIEFDRPTRPARRDGSKSDALDAVRAAREALGRDQMAAPRCRGEREAMRVLVTTREGAVRDRTRAINQLKSVIVSAPETLRARLRNVDHGALIRACSRLRQPKEAAVDERCTIAALKRLAARIQSLDDEIREHDRDIERLTVEHCPQLRAEPGIGPISAANVYIAWSHPGRCRNEAAFANLAGTAPIEASSGQVTRYRLNRGGDRQLNRALHTIVLTRTRIDPDTKDYIARRIAEGKSARDARRCLKRYVARRTFRLLEAGPEEPLDRT
jgi:transposase